LHWTLAIACFASVLNAQSLKPDEIVAKHIESIGKKEARDGIKTLMAVGQSEFVSLVPAIKGGGRAVVVSDPSNLYFILSLNSKEYPFEKIGYFDGKPSLPFATAGTRSLLGSFLSEHDKILSSGLFNGIMSRRWPLLNLEKARPVITSGGTKKFDGRKIYALNYFPSGDGSSEFTIRLYFDAETFHHVRTEYRRQIPPKTPGFGVANQIAYSTLVLTESFSDFRLIDGVTLPHIYRVEFVSNSNNSTYQSAWGIKVGRYVFNQKLTPDFFTFDTK